MRREKGEEKSVRYCDEERGENKRQSNREE
jgi:hypothetical protein